MLSQTLLTIVLAVPLADPADVAATERAPREWRAAVHQTLKLQATSGGSHQEAATRKLLALYRELGLSSQLATKEKIELRALLRSRLRRTSEALEKQLANAAKAPVKRAAGDANSHVPRAVLAQIQGKPAGKAAPAPRGGALRPAAQAAAPRGAAAAGAISFAAATSANAEELVESIQNTIAPESWEANGGLGTIMYFSPRQVLVVRQTGGIHEQIGDAIGALRKN